MTAFNVIAPDGQRRTVSGDPMVIAAAALFLGDGRYKVERADGSLVLPFMEPGDKLSWFRHAFAADLNRVLRDNRSGVAAALQEMDFPRARFLAIALRQAEPGGFHV